MGREVPGGRSMLWCSRTSMHVPELRSLASWNLSSHPAAESHPGLWSQERKDRSPIRGCRPGGDAPGGANRCSPSVAHRRGVRPDPIGTAPVTRTGGGEGNGSQRLRTKSGDERTRNLGVESTDRPRRTVPLSPDKRATTTPTTRRRAGRGGERPSPPRFGRTRQASPGCSRRAHLPSSRRCRAAARSAGWSGPRPEERVPPARGR